MLHHQQHVSRMSLVHVAWIALLAFLAGALLTFITLVNTSSSYSTTATPTSTSHLSVRNGNVGDSSGTPLLARHALLAPSETSHKVAGVGKKVHVLPDRVHGLQQWAVATFESGKQTERHHHPTLTEIFHVKSGVATFEFDADVDVEANPPDEAGAGAMASASTARNVVVAQQDDTITIPPGVFHVVANRHTEPLVLVYASVL